MSNDGYNVNPPVPENIRPVEPPKAPPTTEYVGKRDLPLLPSERRELNEKIKQERQKFELAYSQACSKFTSIINTDESLTLEQKTNILEKLWK